MLTCFCVCKSTKQFIKTEVLLNNDFYVFLETSTNWQIEQNGPAGTLTKDMRRFPTNSKQVVVEMKETCRVTSLWSIYLLPLPSLSDYILLLKHMKLILLWTKDTAVFRCLSFSNELWLDVYECRAYIVLDLLQI